ncbi:hypothetical protein [Streptomyces sp. NBC_00878]|uniref:hypothetical protein n=1 Tax=Streptomyces sp. NBC_00878 TaxID=2975854 RepID=UPI00224C81B7|nr:hypothetical protein [Streptomyces sp. NBC_00878]MCX4910464.1 hypothetical protein [Streptomyces sp. NBC_00878]
MERLDGFGPGELPTRFLLVEFLELVVTSAGIVEANSDNAPPPERQDLTAAVSGVLVRAMQEWAQTAEPELPKDGSLELPWDYSHASEGISRAVGAPARRSRQKRRFRLRQHPVGTACRRPPSAPRQNR